MAGCHKDLQVYRFEILNGIIMYCVSALSYNYIILCEQISPTTSVMSVPSRHLHVTSSVTFHQHLLHPFSGPMLSSPFCYGKGFWMNIVI